MSSDRTREATAVVTGLGLVCIALFAGVSLYTHSAYDVLDYRAAGAHEIENRCGFIGALLAHHLLCLYGAGAWVITLSLLIFGGFMCALRTLSGFISRAAGAVLLTALVCAWCGVGKAHADFSSDYPAGPGGLLGGAYLAPVLIHYFGGFGVYMVLVAAGIFACLLVEQDGTEAALGLLGRLLVNAGAHAGNWALGQAQNAVPVFATHATNGPGRAASEVSRAATAGFGFRVSGNRTGSAALYPKPETRNPKLDSYHPEAAKRELNIKKAAKDRAAESQLEAQVLSEAEAAELRHDEAMRQAEEAEAKRLDREKLAQEQAARDAKALEKLEKERAVKDRERAKVQEKQNAALPLTPSPSPQGGEGSEPAKPKQLPVNYSLPQYNLLIENDIAPVITSDTLKERGAIVIQTLFDFNIGARLVDIHKGPAVTMFEIELERGINVSRINTLQGNLAMALKADPGVRIIAPIPGKSAIGIEVPNLEDYTVRLRPILESTEFRAKSWTLPVILGRDGMGNPLVGDLHNMPHLLIAGTTGSGKSVCVNSIILSLMILRRPHEVKLILVDPKQVEMTDFKGIPHLLSPVVTDMKLAAGVLTWAVQKMEDRYSRMGQVGVRNIGTYNKLTTPERLAKLPAELPENESQEDYFDPMPYIVIIVDEFADLMATAGKEIEFSIQRLAQKARAAGIHVILATQRPSADVVTGLIKTNLPCRICFQVKSKLDSRIVLDAGGAEKLTGKGDMLFVGPGSGNMIRAKGVYVADEEIRGIVKACKDQAEPVYSEEVARVAAQAAGEDDAALEGSGSAQAAELDELFDQAVEAFLAQEPRKDTGKRRASVSLLQRYMAIGYTRAAKLIDQMFERGIVGPDQGPKGRELLISNEAWAQFKSRREGEVPLAEAPQPVPQAVVAVAPVDAKPGSQADPKLLAQLEDVDGVKNED